MYILGISAHYHDSAACLIKDGEILSAAQEERFSRIKHDSNFPKAAIKFCLKEANIKPDLIDSVVFYEKPILKFDRLIEYYFQSTICLMQRALFFLRPSKKQLFLLLMLLGNGQQHL